MQSSFVTVSTFLRNGSSLENTAKELNVQPDYPSAENYLVANYASAAADGNGSNDGTPCRTGHPDW